MLDDIDITLIICMYDESRIGRYHGTVDNILRICTPKRYRDRFPVSKLKKRMRQLATMGFLIRKIGTREEYSLSMRGVRVAERSKDGWTLEEIDEAEREPS